MLFLPQMEGRIICVTDDRRKKLKIRSFDGSGSFDCFEYHTSMVGITIIARYLSMLLIMTGSAIRRFSHKTDCQRLRGELDFAPSLSVPTPIAGGGSWF